MSNLYAALGACFPADRARPFARTADGAVMSYADVEAGSARYAHALRSLGLVEGDRVAVQVEKSLDMILLYLGCVRMGGVFLPLNTAYPAGELTYFLGDAAPALFVCDPVRLDALGPVAQAAGVAHVATMGQDGAGSLAELAAGQGADFPTLAVADDALAAILYTSGTTGRSKGAMLTHRNLASNARVLADFWRFTGDDVLLHALPVFHIHGLFVATNTVLAAGASMLFLPRFDAAEVMRALPDANVMMGVPTFYIRLLGESGFTGDLVAHMRLFVSGSAPLSADIHREFVARAGHAILERYGMSETGMNCSNPCEGERVAGTVGPPLPGVDLRIADPATGAEMPRGEVGMIEVRGANVFKGYWRMPDKTAQEFRHGYFLTGDMGFIDPRGYVTIVGRAKDVVIAGGFNIYPAEVESVLDELPQVRESAVIGLPHPDLGEAVVAVIVPREPGFADDAALGAAMADRLARFKQPRRYIFVPELPKNAMGKVQKKLLREAHAEMFAPSAGT